MKRYDKDKLKNSLTVEQVEGLLYDLGGDPQNKGDFIVSRTICHNPPGEGSYKLYYFDNTKLFKCFTQCAENSFDIYQLVLKVKNLAQEKIKYNYQGKEIIRSWELPDAIRYIATYFGFSQETFNFEEFKNSLVDYEYFNKNEEMLASTAVKERTVDLKIYNGDFLKNLPRPRIVSWESEGISPQVMLNRGICYDPVHKGIVIPHRDIDGNLIGIRERTLVKEQEDFGKYRPMVFSGKMYNHPLGFALYNLNYSKNAIKLLKKAIVFESEKSTLKYASLFGEENDISVACCGSSISSYQIELLVDLGVTEIIIAFDRQYKERNKDDKEFIRWAKKLKEINKKIISQVSVSFMFDKENLLDYKDSPIDKDKATFLYLYNNRIYV